MLALKTVWSRAHSVPQGSEINSTLDGIGSKCAGGLGSPTMATRIVGLAPTDRRNRGRQVEFHCAGPYSQLTSRSSGCGTAGSSTGRATRTADGEELLRGRAGEVTGAESLFESLCIFVAEFAAHVREPGFLL